MSQYRIPLIVHRYVRANGIDDAQRHIGLGAQVHVETCDGEVDRVEYAGVRTAPYRHCGAGENLWRVSLRLVAVLDAPDLTSARETAHALVSVNGCFDAFEPELCVGEALSDLPRAS
jgi:hypothetical protein